jgi:4'-phosphopantetheinyl transferase
VKFNWQETPTTHDEVGLQVSDVHVWAVSLEIDASELRSLKARLPPDERMRASRYLRAEPRRNFVASRAALRAILARYLDVPSAEVAIEFDSNGKPRLAGGAAATDLRFNLAHSGDLALVAIAQNCEIGVDIVVLRPIEHWQQIAARYFHPAEARAISAADPAEQYEAFLRCWTRKEAILKAAGTGLSHSLDSFAVPLSASLRSWVENSATSGASSARSRYWLQALAPRPGYIAAVASVNERREGTGFVFRW